MEQFRSRRGWAQSPVVVRVVRAGPGRPTATIDAPLFRDGFEAVHRWSNRLGGTEDQHERHARVGRHRAQQLRERAQTPGRRADANDWKFIIAVMPAIGRRIGRVAPTTCNRNKLRRGRGFREPCLRGLLRRHVPPMVSADRPMETYRAHRQTRRTSSEAVGESPTRRSMDYPIVAMPSRRQDAT